MGPCIAYCLCSHVRSVAAVVPAPTILCFAPLSIVTACGMHMHYGQRPLSLRKLATTSIRPVTPDS